MNSPAFRRGCAEAPDALARLAALLAGLARGGPGLAGAAARATQRRFAGRAAAQLLAAEKAEVAAFYAAFVPGAREAAGREAFLWRSPAEVVAAAGTAAPRPATPPPPARPSFWLPGGELRRDPLSPRARKIAKKKTKKTARAFRKRTTAAALVPRRPTPQPAEAPPVTAPALPEAPDGPGAATADPADELERQFAELAEALEDDATVEAQAPAAEERSGEEAKREPRWACAWPTAEAPGPDAVASLCRALEHASGVEAGVAAAAAAVAERAGTRRLLRAKYRERDLLRAHLARAEALRGGLDALAANAAATGADLAALADRVLAEAKTPRGMAALALRI